MRGRGSLTATVDPDKSVMSRDDGRNSFVWTEQTSWLNMMMSHCVLLWEHEHLFCCLLEKILWKIISFVISSKKIRILISLYIIYDISCGMCPATQGMSNHIVLNEWRWSMYHVYYLTTYNDKVKSNDHSKIPPLKSINKPALRGEGCRICYYWCKDDILYNIYEIWKKVHQIWKQ